MKERECEQMCGDELLDLKRKQMECVSHGTHGKGKPGAIGEEM